jgi:hypothetical protein
VQTKEPAVLLAVDVGNSQTVIGVFEGSELREHWRISTEAQRTPDELALVFGGLMSFADLSFSKNVHGVIVSSVVPVVTEMLRVMSYKYFHFEPIVVGPGIKTGMALAVDNPREVGADRIVNALAAYAERGGPGIVVDFGTATSFDVYWAGPSRPVWRPRCPPCRPKARSCLASSWSSPSVPSVARRSRPCARGPSTGSPDRSIGSCRRSSTSWAGSPS